MGDLNTHVEFDFYGADGNESVSNSHGFRLRHAYGTLGNFLAGQTWTNFMNPAALPDTVDFGGPVGQIFDRQAQVRWTQPFGSAASGGGGQWSVGLENPETVVQIPGGASFRADDDRLPDVTGQVLFNTPPARSRSTACCGKSASTPRLRRRRWTRNSAARSASPASCRRSARMTSASRQRPAMRLAAIRMDSFRMECSAATRGYACRNNGHGSARIATTGPTTAVEPRAVERR